MIAYCVDREHCLITGIQLLGMVIAGQGDPRLRSEIIEAMFQAIGRLDGFTAWLEVQASANMTASTVELPIE